MSAELGILLIVAGVAYPLAALPRLNRRLGRQPSPSARMMGLLLAFNGVFPVALILWGLVLSVARLGAVLAICVAALVASVAAVTILSALWAQRAKA
jgi:hypothetical protein